MLKLYNNSYCIERESVKLVQGAKKVIAFSLLVKAFGFQCIWGPGESREFVNQNTTDCKTEQFRKSTSESQRQNCQEYIGKPCLLAISYKFNYALF